MANRLRNSKFVIPVYQQAIVAQFALYGANGDESVEAFLGVANGRFSRQRQRFTVARCG